MLEEKYIGSKGNIKIHDYNCNPLEKNAELERELYNWINMGGEIWCQSYPSPDNPGWTRVELK